MKLESCIKIEYGKCEKPDNTIKRLEPSIKELYEYTYVEEKVAEYLYWSAIFIDEFDFQCMGKGVAPGWSKAGALAEWAEWVSSRNVDLMPGYIAAHQKDLKEPHLNIEDLVSHVSTAVPSVIEQVKDTNCAKFWVDGYSLMDNRVVKVPIEFVRRISGPSGGAAGNRIEEAIVHATNEIFERRTHITVLRQKLIMPTIDVETIDSPIIQAQIDFIRSKGIEVYIKDLSFGGELPCVGTYFLDPNIPESSQFHHSFKVGSSFNKEHALMRTFTEYTQGRKLDEFIKADKEEQARILNADFRNIKCIEGDDDNLLSAFMFGFVPYKNADFLKEGDLVPFETSEGFKDCLEDIEKAKEICAKLKKDYVIVDFTDPKVDFPVVQVVIPGYSDILPYHPTASDVLFQPWTRARIMECYN
ncbi:YcaO-like family protein [Verrucomicrobiota bacterium]